MSMERARKFILANHELSEGVVSNLQMLFTFVPGRWTDWEVLFESGRWRCFVCAFFFFLFLFACFCFVSAEVFNGAQ